MADGIVYLCIVLFALRNILFVISLLVLNCCQNNNWTELQLANIEEEKINLSTFSHGQTVFVFLSPECPLCRNYSVKIKELIDEHASDSLRFVGVVGGTYYPKLEIKHFLRKYELDMPVLLDPEFKLVDALDATITPEVFFIEGENIIYQGAIDDWAISLGQKKLKVQNDYLHDAIVAHQSRMPVDPKKTKAVGCFIE